MEMKIYSHPFSQHCRRVHMLCKELDLQVQSVPIAIEKGEHQAAAFLKINPNAQVPVLDDSGFVLSESHAIMKYLCARAQADAWYPAEPRARAQLERWLDWNHTRLNPPVQTLVLQKVFGGDDPDTAAVEAAQRSLDAVLPVLQSALHGNLWLGGERPTIADLSVASTLALHRMAGESLDDHTAVAAWFERMGTRASFRETAPQ